MKHYIPLFAALFLILITFDLTADPQSRITIQGILEDGSSNSINDGLHEITFSIYSAEAGGESLWSETHTLNIQKGVFSASIGKDVDLDIDFSQQLWVGIIIDGADELSPRIQLTTSLYSMYAFTIADNSVNSNKIENSSIAAEDMGQMGAAEGEILTWTGTQWSPQPASFDGADIDDLSDAHSDGTSSVFLGAGAGDNADESSSSTAVGINALKNLTDGERNVAIGKDALYSNHRSNMVAVGYQALYNNGAAPLETNQGIGNTAIGFQSMFNNTWGSKNTAVGYFSLFSNTTGRLNDAFGFEALRSNTYGEGNIAIGFQSLTTNTSGNLNVSVGMQSLFFNQTGSENSSVGMHSMSSNTTGSNNTAVRSFSGSIASGNSGCTFIGKSAETSSTTSLTNSTAIGHSSVISADNQVRIGNSSVSSIGGYADWTNVSDERMKDNIEDNIPGLAFISQLRPISYNLNIEKINGF
jgi:hypothetical protein